MNDSLKQGGVGFISAQPIWPKGREKEMNLLAGFRCAFAAPKGGTVKLRVAAATFYRACLNGQFLNYGPARGPQP